MHVFWLLEDDEITQMIVSSYVLTFMSSTHCLHVVDSAKKIKANPGDVILADQQGVEIEALQLNGAALITMSGNKDLIVDIQKPFSGKALKNIMDLKLVPIASFKRAA